MLQGVNIDEIKKYNASLKQCRDRAASLNAEIEYTNKEIDALCIELSQELGITVTRDNAEQVYNEQIEKINSTLQSGNAVLSKIASEESGAQHIQNSLNTQQHGQYQQQVQGIASPQSQPVPTMINNLAAESQVASPVFSQPQVGGQNLPNLFGA